MHNNIDFSKVERLTPRPESWEKVCARLDSIGNPKLEKNSGKHFWFSFRTTLPIAASFILISLIAVITALSNTDGVYTESIDINEMVTWFDDLGNSDSDFNELEAYSSISQLIK